MSKHKVRKNIWFWLPYSTQLSLCRDITLVNISGSGYMTQPIKPMLKHKVSKYINLLTVIIAYSL